MPILSKLLSNYQTTKVSGKSGAKKKIPKGTLRHTLKKSLKTSLNQSLKGGISVEDAVKLPPGENMNEWIAMNCIELYNTVNLVYSFVSVECTNENCPIMSAGSKVQYWWADGQSIKKPLKVTAPEYVNYLTSWINTQLDDESIFPTNGDFPKDFVNYVKQILRKMFRVYAHIYHSHWKKIAEVEAKAHFILCFKHFYYFVREFDLVEDKEMQIVPVSELFGLAAPGSTPPAEVTTTTD